MVVGENLRQPRHNPGLVPHKEPQIPGCLEVITNYRGRDAAGYVSLSAGNSLRHKHDIGNHSYGGWVPSRTRTQERHVAAVLPGSHNQIQVPLHAPEWRI